MPRLNLLKTAIVVEVPKVPKKGYVSLRRGRYSVGGAEYFVTVNLDRSNGPVDASELHHDFLQLALKLEAEDVWAIRTLVVMPDHLHLLFFLSGSHNLAAAVRLFKGRLSPVLRQSKLSWQPGFFDHHIRSDEDRLPIFRYIFLNPYRAGLLQTKDKWSGYYCSAGDWAWFGPLTDENCPFPEWLG